MFERLLDMSAPEQPAPIECCYQGQSALDKK